MKSIALVELFPYHSECLYSQLLFMQGHARVVLICDQRLASVVKTFGQVYDECVFFDFKELSSLLKLRSYLIRNKINTVVLNTAQGSLPLKFMLLPFPKRIHFAGIIHETQKLTESFGQRLISRKIKSYYVLADYVNRLFPENLGFKHQFFTPAFYPKFDTVNLPDKADEIWVCIPGAIESKRRDYKTLLALAQHPQLKEKVKFILLGNATLGEGTSFIGEIQRLNIAHRFVYFNERVSDELFYSYIRQVDYLLPLIHPDAHTAGDYTKTKISGMFPLSLAFEKTMLCHNLFAQVKGFDYNVLFYDNLDELVDTINQNRKVEHTFTADFDKNQSRYLSLL